jgi:hypothetical protein
MNRTLHLAMAVLVSYSGVFSFAQTTAPPTEQKQSPASPAVPSSQRPPAGSAQAVFGSGSISSGSAIARAAQEAEAKRAHFSSGPLEVLSDTKGVDLGSYLQLVEAHIRSNWHNLIPESARAQLMKKG